MTPSSIACAHCSIKCDGLIVASTLGKRVMKTAQRKREGGILEQIAPEWRVHEPAQITLADNTERHRTRVDDGAEHAFGMPQKVIDHAFYARGIQERLERQHGAFAFECRLAATHAAAIHRFGNHRIDLADHGLLRAGARHEIALHEVTSCIAASVQLLCAFHAFGDDLRSKNMREFDDARHEHPFPPVAIEIPDEEAVDLHVVGLQFVEGLQARMPGAEIVDGNSKAHLAQFSDGLYQPCAGRALSSFGDFEAHARWGNAHFRQHLKSLRQHVVDLRGA